MSETQQEKSPDDVNAVYIAEVEHCRTDRAATLELHRAADARSEESIGLYRREVAALEMIAKHLDTMIKIQRHR